MPFWLRRCCIFSNLLEGYIIHSENHKGFCWLDLKVFSFYLRLFDFSKSTSLLAGGEGVGGMGMIPTCLPSDGRRGLGVSRASPSSMQTIPSSPSSQCGRPSQLLSRKHFWLNFFSKSKNSLLPGWVRFLTDELQWMEMVTFRPGYPRRDVNSPPTFSTSQTSTFSSRAEL